MFRFTALRSNTGKVISWMASRGYGFIEDDNDQKQHFVHFSALQTEPGGYRALSQGQRVQFHVSVQDGRSRAESVTSEDGSMLQSGPRPDMGQVGDRRGRGFQGDYQNRGRDRGRGGNRDGDDSRRRPPPEDVDF